MNENEMMQDDEISLFDLWEKLQNGWRYVVGGAVIGLAGAGAALVVLPPKYEAVAVVQVGQVASFPVEPVTQAVERMKTPAFQTTVAQASGNQEWIDALQLSTNATEKYLSLQIVKATLGGASNCEGDFRRCFAPDRVEGKCCESCGCRGDCKRNGEGACETPFGASKTVAGKNAAGFDACQREAG